MNRAFTLIELLVTMILILLMYFLLFSAGSKPYQERQKILCQKNLQSVHVALKIYAADHQEHFPANGAASVAEEPLSLLVPTCTTDTAIFTCPGSGDRTLPSGEPFASRRASYAYCMGLKAGAGPRQWLVSDRQVNALAKKAGDPLFSSNGKPPGNNHRQFGGNLLFCDGHLESSPPAASQELSIPEGGTLLNPR